MIKTETILIDDKHFIRTYSDKGVKVHGGFPEADYDEAIDPAEFGRTYVETDILIDSSIIDDSEALSILTGGDAER